MKNAHYSLVSKRMEKRMEKKLDLDWRKVLKEKKSFLYCTMNIARLEDIQIQSRGIIWKNECGLFSLLCSIKLWVLNSEEEL